jgi:hypothetical protein
MLLKKVNHGWAGQPASLTQGGNMGIADKHASCFFKKVGNLHKEVDPTKNPSAFMGQFLSGATASPLPLT